jgi:hypothetical protein
MVEQATSSPPGVEEGTRIRLSGEGQAGLNGGPPGDLYIFLSVQQHAIFQRVPVPECGVLQRTSREGEPLSGLRWQVVNDHDAGG